MTKIILEPDSMDEQPCGCRTTVKRNGSMTVTYRQLCIKHQQEKRSKEKMEHARVTKIHMDNLDELKCDQCHKLLCYVYSGDLEGNYFYCKSCRENYLDGLAYKDIKFPNEQN